MVETRVKRLGAKDVEAFRRLRLEALRLAPFAYASSYEEWLALSDDDWRRRLGENPVFAAFVDGSPVGLMGLVRERRRKSAHRAQITMVYVREAMRGQGVSSALLDAVTEHARQLGIRQLELVVSCENPIAYNFYRRNGFVEFGRIPGALCADGREVDEWLMARCIDRDDALS